VKLARSLVLAVSGAALVLAPLTAHAAVNKHLDPKGDLQYIPIDDDYQPTGTPKVSSSTNGDIVVAKVTYTGSSIGITTRFAGLAMAGHHQEHQFEVHAGKYVRQVLVETGSRYWAGRLSVFDGAGNEVAAKYCAPKHKVDYDNDTVTVNVPSSCVKSPTSIRVAVGAIVASTDQSKLYFDDAFATKGSFEGSLRLSPVVKRN